MGRSCHGRRIGVARGGGWLAALVPLTGPPCSRSGQPTVYFAVVADLPLPLDPPLSARLAAALDVEGKIPRALEQLGPVERRDVVLIGGGAAEAARFAASGSRVTAMQPRDGGGWPLPDASADAVVAAWSAFRGVDAAELAEADRVLRPGGRLLVIHDYGRDDVSRLRGDLPEYRLWSRRDGPFLRAGFRIRVVHCFWTFPSIEDAQDFLGAAFGAAGESVGRELKRPRITYNVAVYHRSRGE
jgi:SAM-dependent methyltransferase